MNEPIIVTEGIHYYNVMLIPMVLLEDLKMIMESGVASTTKKLASLMRSSRTG